MSLRSALSSLLVLTVVRYSQSQVVAPVNSAGQTNDSLELNCTVGGRSIGWNFQELQGLPVVIYQDGFVLDDRYKLGSQRHNIIIKSLSAEMAGMYDCYTIDGPPSISRQAQVASADALTCSSSSPVYVEGDRPTLSCGSVISSNPSLVAGLQWSRDSQPVFQETIPHSNAKQPIELRYQFNATAADNGVAFKCQLKFRYDGKSTSIGDDSDPGFRGSCDLVLSVLFSARNTVIEPNNHNSSQGRMEVKVGEQLNCMADGNPAVQYEWIQANNGSRYITGQFLNITEDMMGEGVLQFICKASNWIAGQYFSDTDLVSF